jgi:putative NADH-flavin reductase
LKIALYGPSGMIGKRILDEALLRGHQVTGVVRDPSKHSEANPNLFVEKGDIMDPDGVASIASGKDVVISAYGPGNGDVRRLLDAARSLVASHPKRLIVVGGAGSLEVAPGLQLVDTADFPPAWKDIALTHREAMWIYQGADFDWTYASPAAIIEPGKRTGQFRLGTGQLIVDEAGSSKISAEDFAVAILNEVEHPQFIRQRFTVGY